MLIDRPPFVIHHFPSLGSTNDHLKSMADAPEFTVVTASVQTAGRGRRDRSWHSASDDGLYLSLLLRPSMHASEISLISLLSAVAVAETLIECGAPQVDIKWPNDLLIGERKACGILIEGASSGAGQQRLIVGIGINLNQREFPPEIRETATSLALALDRSVEVAEVRDLLLARLARWYEVWRSGGTREILSRYAELSSYVEGRPVRVLTDGAEIEGVTAGITASGALLLRTTNGERRTIIAGEVVRLRPRDE